MTETRTSAYVAHALPGRLRLRIPEQRGNDAYFADLCERLSNRREFTAVTANAMTGGILLHLAPGVAIPEVAAAATALSLFDVQSAAVPPARPPTSRNALTAASVSFKGADRLIAEASGGFLDLRSILFLLLLAMAIRQISRGHFMVAGFTPLWHAVNMMMK